MNTVLVTLPREADQLVDLRRRLRAWLAPFDLADELRDAIVLATHEAAANAIERGEPSDALSIRASIADETLTIDVSDSGRWDNSGKRPGQRVQALTLIRALMEHTEIQPGPQGTTLHMRQPI